MKSSVSSGIASLVCCIFACGLAYLQASTTPAFLQPIAMWSASSGGLYVLDKDRGLLYIPGSGADLFLKNSSQVAAFRKSWQAVDMAVVHSGTEERIYVVLAQETIGMLLCYSNGGFERSWIAKTVLGGIAADPDGHRLYLSGTLTNEIYSLDLNDPNARLNQAFLTVHESQVLGPMAFDNVRRVVYASDQRIGTIFTINIEDKSVSKLAQLGGQPSALAFDSGSRVLYVTDAAQQKVWAIETNRTVARVRPFSISADFRQPNAVAIDSIGALWVGDPEAHAIFRLSAKGTATAYRLMF